VAAVVLCDGFERGFFLSGERSADFRRDESLVEAFGSVGSGGSCRE